MKLTERERVLHGKLAFVVAPATLSRPIFDRSKEEEARDVEFLEAWAEARIYEANINILPELHYHPGGARQVIEGGKLHVADLKKGLYRVDMEEPAEWPPLLYTLQQDPRSDLPKLFLTPEGAVQPIFGMIHPVDSKSPRYGGFVVAPDQENARYKIIRTMTSEEFKKFYPLDAAHGVNECSGYATGLYSRSTADLYDKAPEVLERFRHMLKLFPSAEVHWVVPVLLRSYGWALPATDKLPAGAKRAIYTPYKAQILLNDLLCWRVHLSIDGAPIPGVAYFTEEGNLVISDWCFREEEMNQEMFHGHLNKHNLLTWVAGPCADRWCESDLQKVKHVGNLATVLTTQWDLLMTLLDVALEVKTPQDVSDAFDKGYDGFVQGTEERAIFRLTKVWEQDHKALGNLDRYGYKKGRIEGRDTTGSGPWTGVLLKLPSVVVPNWVTQLVLLGGK